jgi:hypothetical protein
LLKNFIRYCPLLIDKALCLSAAKKEEYESFLTFRQLLFSLQRPFQEHPNCLISLGTRTIAKRLRAWQGFSFTRSTTLLLIAK